MNGQLVALLADVFGLREADVSLSLTKDDVDSWDSLKQMDLVVSLEKEYDIILELPEIRRMTSLEGICAVLKEKAVDIES